MTDNPEISPEAIANARWDVYSAMHERAVRIDGMMAL